MISSKKSFFLQFILYFSITLVILGIIQATMSGIRLYNASEQEYENLSPKTLYTVPEEIIKPLPEKITTEKTKQEITYYVAENKTLGTEITAGGITKKPEIIETKKNNQKSTQETDKNTEKISQIQIIINPEKETPPGGYEETIQTVVGGKYFRDTLWKFPIIIDTKRVEPRGQMYNESITLGSGMKSLEEVSKVLVHEIGHMIDIYALKKSIRTSDPSQDFYQISWQDPTTIKAGISKTAFISGYASTNQYEDFAESFVMYIFHNREFLLRTRDNDFLKRKYDFLKTQIFGNNFLGSVYEKDPIPKKIWDVTKVALRVNNLDTIFAWISKLIAYKS